LFVAQIDRYQEQPQLLDAHLNDLVGPLMAKARETLRAWHTNLYSEAQTSASVFALQIYDNPYLQKVFQIIYSLCKTRGYKVVSKFFPHEVADLEPALVALLCQDASNHTTWETRYVLLLWLSILVLIPFDLRTVDSALPSARRDTTMQPKGIIAEIIHVCQSYLIDPGAVREAAAACLSRLLTRPDLETAHLERFFTWCGDAVDLCLKAPSAEPAASAKAIAETSAASDANSEVATLDGAALDLPAVTPANRIFLLTGSLQCVVEICKRGHRERLLQCLGDTFDRIIAITNDSNSSTNTTGTSSTAAKLSPLTRQLLVKLAARTGLTLMPPKLVSWRYQRGQRSLLDNLSAAGVAAATHKQRAQADDQQTNSSTLTVTDDDSSVDDVPPRVEEIIDILLNGLRDTDTVVRWSAAKGSE
jgi:hypothetical protein